jgi:hypothetical protein
MWCEELLKYLLTGVIVLLTLIILKINKLKKVYEVLTKEVP